MRRGKEIDFLVLMQAKLGGSAKVAQILEEDIKDGLAYLVTSASGSPASFPDGADNIPVKDLTVSIEPVQSGSGDPSPSNVRPITGWTGCNIVHGGIGDISFTPNKAIDGSGNIVDSSGGGYSELISVSTADDAVVINNIATDQKRIRVHAYDESGAWLRQVATINILAGDPVGFYKIAISLTNTEKYLRISTGNLSTAKLATVGHQIPITFPTEAGTVYGGTLDVTTGVLTVTHGQIASYNGETLPGEWISDRDVYAEGTSPSTGAQVVYELATHITYQLTPTEVKTLLGDNNICADCGPVEVEYRADLDKYIEKREHPTEAAVGTLGLSLGAAPSMIRPGVGLEMQDYPMDAPGSDWSGRLYPEDAPWDEKPEGFPDQLPDADEYLGDLEDDEESYPEEPEEEDTKEEEPEVEPEEEGSDDDQGN